MTNKKEKEKAQKITFKNYFIRKTGVLGWNLSKLDTDNNRCSICGIEIKEEQRFIVPPDHLNNHIYDKWCMHCWDDAHNWSKCEYI